MAKKFISLVLTLVMVISMSSALSASAEVTVQIDDGFETYSKSAYNEDFSAAVSIYDTGDSSDYDHYWYAAKNMSLEIVDMIGPDGNMTKAAEITVNSCAVGTNTDGSTRFQYSKNGLGADTGVVVQEMDIYIDDNTMTNVYFSPIFIQGSKIGVGETQQSGHNTLKTVSNGWHHIMAVTMLDGTEGANLIGYVDGKCISYKECTRTSVSRMFQVYGKKLPGYKTLTVDNVKLYINPDATTASSTYADRDNVLVSANPTVDFSAGILDREVGDIDTVSTANVTMTKADGEVVELDDVTVGNNYKSIVIEPAETLEPGATYNVAVTGLTDMYEKAIEAYEFSFTTADVVSVELEAAPKFTKANLFSNTQGAELTALENGYINVKYTLKNTSATKESSAVLLTVLRDGGDIKYFQFENGTLAPGAELSFDGSFMVDDAESQTIETYVWDSLSGAAALTDKYIISKDGITNVSVENQ